MNIIVAILILGLIIIIHELGHFLLAKKNGITVTEFSIGMGPRLASFKHNGTRYSLKLLPIGGSCMMLGEDESLEDENAFNNKSVGARFSVIFAGAFFNFILAFILALVVLGTEGVDIPNVLKVDKNSPAAQQGIMVGDRITKINGTKIHMGKEIMAYFYFNPLSNKTVKVTYVRDGVQKTATLQPEMVDHYQLGFLYNSDDEKAAIQGITQGFPLEQAKLVTGDVIVGINGTKINAGKDITGYFENNPLTDTPVTIAYTHDGVENTVTVTPKLSSSGYELGWVYNTWYEKVSPLKVVEYSFYELRYNIVNTIKSLGYLITGKIGVKEISGPVGVVNFVGQIVNESKDYGIKVTLLQLASFTILISANLGVMNLLPLPALDGGRLVFLLIEAVRRKPVPKEKEAMVHFVGMALLMILMVFVLYNDIRNIFG